MNSIDTIDAKIAAMLSIYILAVDTLAASDIDKKKVLKDAIRRSLALPNEQRGAVQDQWGQAFWDAIQELDAELDAEANKKMAIGLSK